MNRTMLAALVLACMVVAFMANESHAAIFKYVDKDGLINFADDIQSVPQQYRATASIVSGGANDETSKKPSVQQPQQAVGAPSDAKPGEPAVAVPSQKNVDVSVEKKGLFSSRMVLSLIIVVSALFAFVVLGVLDADHKKAIAIARIVILWGVSVYLLYAHTMDVVHLVGSIGTKIDTVQQQSGEKGKKASQAMKKLNDLIDKAEQATAADPGTREPEKKE